MVLSSAAMPEVSLALSVAGGKVGRRGREMTPWGLCVSDAIHQAAVVARYETLRVDRIPLVGQGFAVVRGYHLRVTTKPLLVGLAAVVV